MASAQNPPKVNITLLEIKNLKHKSVPWENMELPIDILLLTVKDCEFLGCLSFLNPGFTKSYCQNLGYVYLGNIGEDGATKLKIALVKCNEGSTVGGSGVVVKNAVAALRPKAVISVGYCASLNRVKAKLGDVVVSARLITYAPTEFTENGIVERGHSVPPNKHLADLIKSVDEGWEAPLQTPGELDVKVDRDGVFLSGPEKVLSQERCAQLTTRFPDAVAIEMEGEGLFAAAHDLQIEWIIIKGISEYADGSIAPGDSWRRFASVMAASLTANMLNDPNVFQTWRHHGDECPQNRPLEQTERTVPSRRPLAPATNNTSVKTGTPTDDDLEELSNMLADNWDKLGRRLGFDHAKIIAYHKENEKLSDKAFAMLMDWKQNTGSDGTYRVLYDALCHNFVKCKLIAEQICCGHQ